MRVKVQKSVPGVLDVLVAQLVGTVREDDASAHGLPAVPEPKHFLSVHIEAPFGNGERPLAFPFVRLVFPLIPQCQPAKS